ncbi:MAG: glycosyltransferase [Caulobacter sp.]|nr:glycosyltransferase [Caulobacter sp.]
MTSEDDDRTLNPPRSTSRTQAIRPDPRRLDQADPGWARGAARPATLKQRVLLLATCALPLTGLVLAPGPTQALLHDGLFALFGLTALTRLAAALTPRSQAAPPQLGDPDLPGFTIIAPLYREAAVAPELVAALDRLDYPRDRLQALIVVESDDPGTHDALAALRLPAFVRVLTAPPGLPRTKPRACNIALQQATGDLVTIYDAEDRPDPGQLREAAARFAVADARLACLQAPLRIEPDRRLLPAQFALEYAVQFEVLLPALTRCGAPFPLGGTSNHFRTRILRAVGGWDAWNVTEDADLGFRLAAEGYGMGVLNAPTWEPAPGTLADWLPQRARWVKGYMQTFGVQSRDPPHWRMGAAAAFAITLGSTIVAAFLHGPLIAWVVVATVLGLATDGRPWVSLSDGLLLTTGWAGAALAAIVGLRRAGSPLRLRDLLVLPVYWPLLSLAAAHALVQLIDRPFHWDKTPHAPRTGQAGV